MCRAELRQPRGEFRALILSPTHARVPPKHRSRCAAAKQRLIPRRPAMIRARRTSVHRMPPDACTHSRRCPLLRSSRSATALALSSLNHPSGRICIPLRNSRTIHVAVIGVREPPLGGAKHYSTLE